MPHIATSRLPAWKRRAPCGPLCERGSRLEVFDEFDE
jgi:hypothetical protein